MDRAVNVGFRGEMDDGIDSFAPDDLLQRLAITDVPLDEREALVICERLQVGEVRRVRKRVQTDDDVGWMVLRPVLDEVGADESGCSRDQHSTHRLPCLRSFSLCVLVELYAATPHPPMLLSAPHNSLMTPAMSCAA